MADVTDRLAAELLRPGVEVVQRRPLALHTTLRVGGEAALFVTVDHEDGLRATVETARSFDVPILVLGRGSNLLVGDDGWPGLVLRLGSEFRGIEISGTRVVAGAAEPMPSVAVRSAQAGLTGFAWGAAVPGSMGGGVRMNAGAHGGAMADSLVSARVIDMATNTVEEWDREQLAFGYRSSALSPSSLVTQVELQLREERSDIVLAEIDAIRAWRRIHQPLDRPSCGSVFTNPPGRSAGELIERSGLKGTRIGGAEISHTHANFIVTDTTARAKDVDDLIALTIARVQEHTGIALSPEVVRPDPGRPSTDGR